MSCIIRKPVSGFLTQKMARGMKFLTWEVEGLYYLFSENIGAELHAAYAKSRFSHDMTHMFSFLALLL